MSSVAYALHNSRQHRAPFGAVAAGTKVTISFFMKGYAGVVLRLWRDGEQRIAMKQGRGGAYTATVNTKGKPSLLWYWFELLNDGGETVAYYGQQPHELGGEGQLYESEPPSFQITVYDAAFAPPKWLRNSVMMQIFPDRFCRGGAGIDYINRRDDIVKHLHWLETPNFEADPRSGDNLANDFFGGNLHGIIEKLPFLADLGINVLYLNPIFMAKSNHRYDTGDYLCIDPLLGDEDDFRLLCEKAAKLGIRIMLDGVFSHTGEDSRYFNRYGNYDTVGAYQSKDSEYYNWYTFKQHPNDYECWWGVPTLPEVREEQPSYLDFIVNSPNAVAAHWLKAGASGWRLDVADELPDVFLDSFYRRVKAENPDAAVMGEVWEDASHKVAYNQLRRYLLGGQMDTVMNYPLRDALISFLKGEVTAQHAALVISSLRENYPAAVFYSLMNLMGSHDRERIVNMLSGAEEPPRHEQAAHRLTSSQLSLGLNRAKLFFMFLCSMPGMPCVYYGDEIGMEGWRDPFNRRTRPWEGGDSEHFDFIKQAIRARRKHTHLSTGELVLPDVGDDVLCAVRSITGGIDALGDDATDGIAACLINRSNSVRQALVPVQNAKISKTLPNLGVCECRVVGSGTLVTLPPLSGVILG